MKIDEINELTAAQNFVRSVIMPHFVHTVDAVTGVLKDGPTGSKPPAYEVDMYKWFNSLSPEGRTQAEALVRYSVDLTLFSLLVVLDGASTPTPVEGQLADHAVVLQVYSTAENQASNISSLSLRVNPIDSEYMLHDIYADLFNENVDVEE
jgi:hypothetical protein